ncbi:MAG: lytic murein transglycosylase, partial [Burkholderiales bacterium]
MIASVKRFAFLLCIALLFPGNGQAAPLNPDIEAFIREMAKTHHFNSLELRRIFSQVKFQPEVLKAISTPATTLPWDEYRALFI